MRKVALFLAVVLILTSIPVYAAPPKVKGYEYTDRDAQNYQILNSKTQVVINRLYTTDEFRQKLGRELQEVQVAEIAPAMASNAWLTYRSASRAQQQAKNYLYQNISNSELFVKGCSEILKVVLEGITQGAHNLNDPQKRYEFWKSRGIYDKFSPRQIEYINKVCMPAMTIITSVAGTVGATVAAAGLAALSGVSFPILAATGMAAFVGLTAIKFKQMKDKKADIALFGKEPLGLSKYTGGLILGQAAQASLAGALESSTTAPVAALAGGSLSSFLPMLAGGGGFLAGSAVGIGASVGLLSILNAGPIPQEGEGGRDSAKEIPFVGPDYHPEVPTPKEFSINYRLSQ